MTAHLTPQSPQIQALRHLLGTIEFLNTELKVFHLGFFSAPQRAERHLDNIKDILGETFMLLTDPEITRESLVLISKSYLMTKQDITTLRELCGHQLMSAIMVDAPGQPHPVFALYAMIEAFNAASGLISLADMSLSYLDGPPADVREKAQSAPSWDKPLSEKDNESQEGSRPPAVFMEFIKKVILKDLIKDSTVHPPEENPE